MPASSDHPLMQLGEEDLAMITAFVLVSGSIKDLAGQYRVSYPTMRQRLNRLIERLRERLEGEPADPLGDYLADLICKGQLSPDVARRIRELHRQTQDPNTPDGETCDD